jgi:hypothetical protein
VSYLWAVACGSLVGLLVRIALFVSAVLLFRALSLATPVLVALFQWADPVYTHATLLSLGDVQLDGLAVAGPLGSALHTMLPGVFADPARAHLALVRVVVHSGSAVNGRVAAATIAHAGALTLGTVLVARGARRYLTRHVPGQGLARMQPQLVLFGIAVQVQVALSILSAQPTLRELESTGISFAANALLPWFWQRGLAISDRLASTPQSLVEAVLVALALLIGYVPAGVLVAFGRRGRAVALASALGVVLTTAACAGAAQPSTAAVSGGVGAPAAPLAEIGAANVHPVLPPVGERAAGIQVQPVEQVVDRWFDDPLTTAALGPSHVEVRGGNHHFELLVNGQPQVIKGMGLNTQYAQFMSPTERAARLDADMAAYQQLGVNTVLGWDPAEFDGALLDSAARHDIGVVLPFDLDPEADYTDPQFRQQLRDQVLTWVARNRDQPALVMWGLGNEVLHKIVHPAWVGPQDPRRELNAEAFSDWLVETADAIHAADPNHPVTYRSAEDAFVPWVVAALKRHPGDPRPWFVWGTNCYQDYLSTILDNWPDSGMDNAIWVSEFAPGTLAIPDRPDGFAAMWQSIRKHPDWVLGGAVYAWTRNGPEGVDRNFGLTDDGTPVDGRSLDTLTELFHQE